MRLIFLLFFQLTILQFGQGQKPELVVQMGHGSLLSATFSSDGKYILTSGENIAKLWDVWGRELQIFSGHTDLVQSAAFSPDGKHILTGSLDDTAKLWDLQGTELLTLTGHHSDVLAVAFSPNGQYLVTAASDATAILWDLKGREIQTFRGHSSDVWSVAFSPSGLYVLTGAGDHTAKLWDLQGNELRSFAGHTHSVSSVAFSSSGEYILTGSWDTTARMWNLQGNEIQTFQGHRSAVLSVAISADGKHILTGSFDRTAKIWDLNGQEIMTFRPHRMWVRCVAFSPDGQRILTGSEYSIRILDLAGRELQSLQKYESTVLSVAFSPDESWIVTGHWDYTGKLLDIYHRKLLTLKGHSLEVSSVTFSSDGKALLTGSLDGTGKLWDLSGQELTTFRGHTDWVNDIKFSPDGQKVLTASSDSTARLWSLNGDALQTFKGHNDGVNAVAFSPDGQMVLTGGRDSTAKLWSLDGHELQMFKGHTNWVNAVAFSPDGQRVLTGGRDSVTRLWDLNGQTLQDIKGHKDEISFLSFSPDGHVILTGSDDRTARLWDLNGNEIRRFTGHDDKLTSGQFINKGKQLITGSYDNTAKLWDVSSGENLLTFISFSDDDGSWAMIRPDQYYMVSNNKMKYIHFKNGLQAYNFEQFDLRLNRPDKIQETLLSFGADSSLMLQYRQAYYKRLEKYGFTEEMLSDDYHVPECTIPNLDQLPISTLEGIVQLQIEAYDSLLLLDRLNVYINDVPLYGIQGINLRDQNTQNYKTTLDIPLSRDENKIQVSALNQGGAESLKATTYITYDAPEQKPDLYLITIGTSDYRAEGKDLRYAAKDARDIAELYQNADGFQEVHTKILTDDQVTKTNILALRSWLEQSQVDDQVLIYVSGHGLIDNNNDFYYATNDIDFANPSQKGILYDEIEGLLDGIPARKKLLLMDACHSGEYDADAPPLTAAQQDSLAQKGISFKGFSKGEGEGIPTLGLQNSFEMMQQLFADLRRGSGATVITSSAGVQVSFEDEEWQNGSFTYAFLYGLKSMKADANQDGQVTASEIQAFVAEYVPRLTEGLQVPTFRRENLEFDFRVW